MPIPSIITKLFFLVMRTFKIRPPRNFQIYHIVLLTTFVLLPNEDLWHHVTTVKLNKDTVDPRWL